MSTKRASALQKSCLDLLPQLAGRRIVVVGDLILDRFVWGDVKRISPEAPVPVVEVIEETDRLGGAANVAQNLVALGARVQLVGVVGKDQEGRRFRRMLRRHGIPDEFVWVDPQRRTTTKTRIIAHHQQVCRFDRETPPDAGANSQTALSARVVAALREADAVILSDYAKGVVTRPLVEELAKHCRARDLFLAADPKRRDFRLYRDVSLITPNRREAEEATGVEIRVDGDVLQAARQIRRLTRCRAVLITLGEAGMALLDNTRLHKFSAAAKEVFDVTGAGDTVVAVCTLAVAAGGTLQQAAFLANHAAGIVVGKLGTAWVETTELAGTLQSGG